MCKLSITYVSYVLSLLYTDILLFRMLFFYSKLLSVIVCLSCFKELLFFKGFKSLFLYKYVCDWNKLIYSLSYSLVSFRLFSKV